MRGVQLSKPTTLPSRCYAAPVAALWHRTGIERKLLIGLCRGQGQEGHGGWAAGGWVAGWVAGRQGARVTAYARNGAATASSNNSFRSLLSRCNTRPAAPSRGSQHPLSLPALSSKPAPLQRRPAPQAQSPPSGKSGGQQGAPAASPQPCWQNVCAGVVGGRVYAAAGPLRVKPPRS